jgi:RNA polymerase sigma-70 factor (ECF subfamily)
VSPDELLAETVRIEGRRVLATLIRTVGDLQLAEDAVQEATIAALRTWSRTGVPENPRAWLTATARHKALDHLRRESVRSDKESAAEERNWSTGLDPAEEAIEVLEPESVVRDDLLRLVFTCCHPSLGRKAQVALALRTLGGLEVVAIARAFMVPEATMAKRLVRARQKIAAANIPYRVPADSELPDRLPGVLAVVYLIATEAHAPSVGDDVVRVDLEVEALRLSRLLVGLMPDEAEVLSLLALLLLIGARRPARVDRSGNPVLLAEQDRSKWDGGSIEEGSARLAEAVRLSVGVAGPYQLQAHLAACHSTAPTWAGTDWERIVGLYDLLLGVAGNPAVSLNRAVAVAKRDGAQAGLAALDAIASHSRSHLWHAARADMLSGLDRDHEAEGELRLAVDLAPTGPDRRLLLRRLGALSIGGD